MLLATIFISLAISNFSFFVSTSIVKMPSIDGFEDKTSEKDNDKTKETDSDIMKINDAINKILIGSEKDSDKLAAIDKKMTDEKLTDKTLKGILDKPTIDMPSATKIQKIHDYIIAGIKTSKTSSTTTN
jgi:hypothetical protein